MTSSPSAPDQRAIPALNGGDEPRGGARDASTLSGMLATTLVGIVFVPGLFVLFRKPSEMKTDK